MRLPSPLLSVCLCALLPAAAPAQTSATPGSTAQPAAIQPSASASAPAGTTTVVAALPTARPAPISAQQRRKAEDAYLAGARQLDHDDPRAAMTDFARAVELDPANPDYPLSLNVAREHRVTQLVQQASVQRLQGRAAEADTLLQQARALDPQNQIVAQHFDSAAPGGPPPAPDLYHAVPDYAGAIHLNPSPIVSSFHLRAQPIDLINTIVKTYGIAVTFDSSVNLDPAQIRLDLDDVTYNQVMPILFSMTHTFAVPLDPTHVLIAKDTADNRQRLEPLLMETITVPSQTTTEINEISTLLKNVFEVQKIAVAPNSGSLVFRAPEKTLQAINLTLGDMLDGGSAILLDMRVYEVDTTRTRNIGITLPQTLGAYNLASSAESAVTTNQATINQAISSGILKLNGSASQNLFTELAFLFEAGLLNTSQFANTLAIFGGGITTTGLYSSGVSLNFGLNSSDTRVLDDLQTRVDDGKDSTIRIGTRYPIATAIYSSSVPALPANIAGANINGVSVQSLLNQFSGAASSIPQFSFEDLGLTLKLTPTVQRSGLVTLKLDFKIEALSGGSINSVPILDNRSLSATVTVADGASALIASNLTRSESNAVDGTPGLSELPGFQSVPNSDNELDTGRLVIIVTPHIVRRRSDLVASRPVLLNLPHADLGN